MEEAGSKRRSSDWDIRNAPKNYVSLVAAHVITAVFSFASVWIITRYLGSAQYGSIIALVAASQLAQIFLNWSSTSLTRFGIEEFVETGYITRSFWSRTWLFLPNLALIIALAGVWLQPVSDWLKLPGEIVWLVVVHIVATSVWLHVQYALQGIKMLRLQGILVAAERAVTLTSLLILIFASRLTLENAVWCYILPAGSLSVAGLFFLRRHVESRAFFDKHQLRKMFSFSLPLIPFAIVGYLATSQLDAFFIVKYFSARELGIYAVATQINGILIQFPILANTILLSMVVSLRSAGKGEAVQAIFRDVVPSLTLLWSFVCVALAISVYGLIPFIFGTEFLDSGPVLWILTGATVCSFPVLIGFASLSNAYSKTSISMFASFATAGTNLVFNFLLIPRFGILGCAWATLLSAFAGLLVFYVALVRKGLMSPSWILISLFPTLSGALGLTAGIGPVFAALIFISSSSLVAYLFRAQITYAVGLIWKRFYAQDVSLESSRGKHPGLLGKFMGRH